MLRLSVHAEGQEGAIGNMIGDWNASAIGGEFGNIKIVLEKNSIVASSVVPILLHSKIASTAEY